MAFSCSANNFGRKSKARYCNNRSIQLWGAEVIARWPNNLQDNCKTKRAKIEKQPSTCIRQSYAVLVSWLHIFASSYPFPRLITFVKNCITQALESWQTYAKFGNLWTKVIIFCNFLTKVTSFDNIALIYEPWKLVYPNQSGIFGQSTKQGGGVELAHQTFWAISFSVFIQINQT